MIQIRDTIREYGLVTRVLHWVMVLLFCWQFVGMALRLALGRVPLVAFFVGTHPFVGTVLFIFGLTRIVWALSNRGNRPAYDKGMIGIMARRGHVLLYAFLFVVPLLALVRAYGSGRGLIFFGLEVFPATEREIGWMVAPANALHGFLAWSLLALIVGHVMMALVHQFIWRDNVFARMLHRG